MNVGTHVGDSDPLRSFRRTSDAAGSSRAPRARGSHGRGGRPLASARRGNRRASRGDHANSSPGPRPRLPASDLGDGRTLVGARSGHLHVAESHEVALLAAGAAIDAVERVMGGSHTRRRRAGSPARPPRRARSCDGVLPLQQRRGRRRRTPARRAPRRSPSSTTTSTTATARSTSSRPIRTSSTSPRISIPYYPGTGAADEVGARRDAASPSTCRSRSGASTRTTSWCSRGSSCRCCGSSSPI